MPAFLLAVQQFAVQIDFDIPVVRLDRIGVRAPVTVGEVPHPMEQKHYIQWIEVLAGDKTYRKYLTPNEAPKVFFEIQATDLTVREYCNLHGLWRATS